MSWDTNEGQWPLKLLDEFLNSAHEWKHHQTDSRGDEIEWRCKKCGATTTEAWERRKVLRISRWHNHFVLVCEPKFGGPCDAKKE